MTYFWKWAGILILFGLWGCQTSPSATKTTPTIIFTSTVFDRDISTEITQIQSTASFVKPTLQPPPTATSSFVKVTVASTDIASASQIPPLGTATTEVVPQTTPTFDPYFQIVAPEYSYSPQSSLNALVSSWGQLAFIQDKTLYVEMPANSDTFIPVYENVTKASWSPDGSKLLFIVCNEQCEYTDIRLWDAKINQSWSLPERIQGFPLPPYHFSLESNWSPNGRKIFFTNLSLNLENIYAQGNIFSVNLTNNQYILLTDELYHMAYIWDMTSEVLIFHSRCGTGGCSNISGRNHQFEEVWSMPATTMGNIALAHDNTFIINAGWLDYDYEQSQDLFAIEKLDMRTGERTKLWNGDARYSLSDFSLAPKPTLSPDDRFFAFYLGFDAGIRALKIVDMEGNEYGEMPTSWLMDWRPNGYPVVVNVFQSKQQQLIYWALDGTMPRVFVTPKKFEFIEGKWSPDGHYFVYSTLDKDNRVSYLYLWQPESGAPKLIATNAGINPQGNFVWHPSGDWFYYGFLAEGGTVKMPALYKYHLPTQQNSLIAPIQ